MTVYLTDLGMATAKDARPVGHPFLACTWTPVATLHPHSTKASSSSNRLRGGRERDDTMAAAKNVDGFPAGGSAISDPNEGHGGGVPDIEAGGTAGAPPAPAPATTRPRGQRLVSLDVFRGITVVECGWYTGIGEEYVCFRYDKEPAAVGARRLPRLLSITHRRNGMYGCTCTSWLNWHLAGNGAVAPSWGPVRASAVRRHIRAAPAAR
ncbi:hypothetical protein HU200_063750 [Digitaria exilis]|uniref:Uncharacterized protein n=1 Tax=Digitaria exilis TaxID=1010633 RepID=A0A835A6P1_9POAL|nr:hypothetical protein HU200_063750 [Digitaria exilis]